MFGIFKKTLQKTVEVIKNIIPVKKEKIEKELIEEMLIASDVSFDIVEKILEELPKEVSRDKLEKELLRIFPESKQEDVENIKPFVEIIIGVNGAGKTTTIAKLAKLYLMKNRSVILGAGDTFRAAAIEQLKKWSDKLGTSIVFTKQGHDPSAVAFDTITSAISRRVDNVIIDTAGRLHNKENLSNELKKIIRVSQKALSDSPHRKILIIDGTQGSSSIAQAKTFNELIEVDGVIVTKLDGTSKGGAIFTIAGELNLPILYIGVGEKEDDLIEFNKEKFIASILDEIYTQKV